MSIILVIGERPYQQLAQFMAFGSNPWSCEYASPVDVLAPAWEYFSDHPVRLWMNKGGEVHAVDFIGTEPTPFTPASRAGLTYIEDIAAAHTYFPDFLRMAYKDKYLFVHNDDKVDNRHQQRGGWIRVDAKGAVTEFMAMHNLQGVWSKGGEYHNALLAKNTFAGTGLNGYTHSTTKACIDFETMREESFTFAMGLWRCREEQRELAGLPEGITWNTYDELLVKHKGRDCDAYAEYTTQDAVRLMHPGSPEAVQPLAGYRLFDDFATSKDIYINRYINASTEIKGVIRNGELDMRPLPPRRYGTMNADTAQWDARLWETINALPDDALLSTYVCEA